MLLAAMQPAAVDFVLAAGVPPGAEKFANPLPSERHSTINAACAHCIVAMANKSVTGRIRGADRPALVLSENIELEPIFNPMRIRSMHFILLRRHINMCGHTWICLCSGWLIRNP